MRGHPLDSPGGESSHGHGQGHFHKIVGIGIGIGYLYRPYLKPRECAFLSMLYQTPKLTIQLVKSLDQLQIVVSVDFHSVIETNQSLRGPNVSELPEKKQKNFIHVPPPISSRPSVHNATDQNPTPYAVLKWS